MAAEYQKPRLNGRSCAACGAPVIWAQFPDGPKPIERCPEGEGSVALQDQLPGLGGRRTIARVVSGVRTSYRLHIETCSRAGFYRSRWQTRPQPPRLCVVCRLELLELGTRAMCIRCQEAQRAKLHSLAAAVVARFGPDVLVAKVKGGGDR